MKRTVFFICILMVGFTQSRGQTYDAGDVAVINNMITNHGLQATLNAPSRWSGFLNWEVIGGSFRVTQLGSSGKLTGNLDISALSELQYLELKQQKLTSLNVSGLTKLTYLNCGANQWLTSLNVKGCVALKFLKCSTNQLTSLDVSGCDALASLECYDNKLTSLNVSGCTKLEEFNCMTNQLDSLDVSGLSNLYNFQCNDNRLTSLNVSGCTRLQILACHKNWLTSLDMTGLKNVSLQSTVNPLTRLVLADGSELTLAASPPEGGYVSVMKAGGTSITVGASANKGYTFYDWTMDSEGKSQNIALPAQTKINLSKGIHATMTANFTGAATASIFSDKTLITLK